MAGLLSYDWPGNIRELENLATYYKTLSALPEYILHAVDSQEPYNGEDRVTSLILRIIKDNTELSHGIGRSSLLHELSREGVRISDQKLRYMLNQMDQDGRHTVIGKAMRHPYHRKRYRGHEKGDVGLNRAGGLAAGCGLHRLSRLPGCAGCVDCVGGLAVRASQP